jgi:hypothetical protein
MAERRQPDSDFIFPSPRRGENDVPTVTLNKALTVAREKSGVQDFTCHLCRQAKTQDQRPERFPKHHRRRI